MEKGGVRIVVLAICFFAFPSYGQVKNMMLADGKGMGVDGIAPSVTINPKNTKNIAAVSGPDLIIRTEDGGLTWSFTHVEPTAGVPSVIFDAKGDLYYFFPTKSKDDLVGFDQLNCQRSTDGGKTFRPKAVVATGQAGSVSRIWTTVHPKKQILYATWKQSNTTDSGCSSDLYFSSSSNGEKWNKPIRISQKSGDCDNDMMFSGVAATNYEGRTYVAWPFKELIYMDRTYDGSMFLSSDMPIFKQAGGAVQMIPGMKHVLAVPDLSMDVSASRAYGTLYLLFAEQSKGSDDTDIVLMKSRDHGDHWTAPLRVNKDEPGKQQFMPWLAVDPITGNVYIAYYDRRAYTDQQTDVYLAYSSDGGVSFTEMKISEKPFVPSPEVSLGDHINIAAHGGTVCVIWTRVDDGKASAWSTIINNQEEKKKK